MNQLAELSKLYSEVHRNTTAKIVIGLAVGLAGAVFCYLHIFWQLGFLLRVVAAIIAGLIFRNLGGYALDQYAASALAKAIFICWCMVGIFAVFLIKTHGFAYFLKAGGFDSNAAMAFAGLQTSLHFSPHPEVIYAQSFAAWILFGIFLLGTYARLAYQFVVISYSGMKAYFDRKDG